MTNNLILSRMHQLIEFIGNIIALCRHEVGEVNNDILRTEIVRAVGERRKDKDILPLAQVRIKIIARRYTGVGRNLVQEQLNMLFAASRIMISPEIVQHGLHNYQ